MCPETEGESPARQVGSNLDHFFVPIEERHVNRKLYPESVNGLAGRDPQSFAGSEGGTFQQTDAGLGDRIGEIGSGREQCPAREVGDSELAQSRRNGSTALLLPEIV